MLRRIFDPVARFVVGGLFIFSGLLKLNDPVGTEIKLEEYFHVFATDFGSFFAVFVPAAMEIGFILVVLEVVLGVAVLIYYRMNITAVVLLVLIVFFTFLTFYSAAFDKVTDCGCFGDAIKLTPVQSFWKDVVLLALILHLFRYRKEYRSSLASGTGHAIIAGVTVISIVLGVYAIRHLPFIDFRPYKIGNSIPEQMQPAEQPIIEYIFEKDGQEVRSLRYLPESEGYTYKESSILNEEETVPKISDYAVADTNGNDVTQSTFEGAKLLIIIYDVSKVSTSAIDEIRALVKGLGGSDVEVMALTASGAADFEAFRHEYQLPVSYYFADATVLKTIIRSNPGLTLWVDGVVRDKWHYNDVPNSDEVLYKGRE